MITHGSINPLSKPPCPASQSTDKRTTSRLFSHTVWYTSRFALRPFKIRRGGHQQTSASFSRLPAIDLDTLRTRHRHPNSRLRVIAMTLKRSTSSIFRLVSRVAALGHPSTTIYTWHVEYLLFSIVHLFES
jgi:hypothetical protein